MRRISSKDSLMEKEFRGHLWAAGVRYRKHYALTGKPDLAIPRKRIAVFIDSCFWHGCEQHCRLPATRRDYWLPKIERNKTRDIEVNADLRKQGWTVIRVWEHEIKASIDAAVQRVVRAVRSN